MSGLLKTKSAGSQFLLLISIALVSFFVLGLVGTIILSSVTGIDLATLSDPSKWVGNTDKYVTVIRGLQVIQFFALFVVPCFVCAKLFSTDTKKYLGLQMPANGAYFLVGIGLMFISIPLINFLGEMNRHVQFPSGIEAWMKKSEEEAARTIRVLLSKHTMKDLVLNVIFIAVLAGIGEELLFRGMVQRLLIKMFKSPWAGIIISAAIFSAFHLQFYGFLPRFVLGIVLGAMYWYSGSLWVPIIAHFIYDALLVILSYYNPEMLGDETSIKLSNIALAASLSFAAVTFLIIWMKKRSTVTYETVYAKDPTPDNDHPFDFD